MLRIKPHSQEKYTKKSISHNCTTSYTKLVAIPGIVNGTFQLVKSQWTEKKNFNHRISKNALCCIRDKG